MVIPIAVIDWQPFPAGLDLADRPRVGTVVLADPHRAGLPLRTGGEAWPFIYSVIVFTALIDWIVWDHRPTLFMYLGMALVIGGGLIAIRAKPHAPSAVIDA